MSWWAHVLLFACVLPIAVWLWAAFMAIFDNEDKVLPLVRFTASLLAVFALIVLIGRGAIWSFTAAQCVVIAAHVVGFWAVRKFFVGVDVH